MNDAERDAWLREALRHAPDADALPPTGISETILLKARAAARAGAAAPLRRDAARVEPAGALGRFWAWLARPPVAGAFASVMAATLVGLMWWDRPIDETLVRPPAPHVVQREAGTSRPAVTANAVPAQAPAPEAKVVAPAPAPEAKVAAPVARPAAKIIAPAPATAPVTEPAKPKTEPLAKEQAPAFAANREAPAAFPSAEAERQTLAAARPLDAAKKDAGASEKNRDAAPAVLEDRRGPARANIAESDALGRADAPGAGAQAAATGALRAQAAAPTETTAQRRRSLDDERDKATAGFAAAPPAPFRSAPAAPRSEASGRSTAAPLASVIAAIAADPGAWSRRAASGDSFALEPGWRSWLSEVDAAAAGRWRPIDNAATTSGDSADRDPASTTLRLVSGGKVAAVVRLEGAGVQVDLPAGGGRWQATLAAEPANRLRSSATRLSR